MNTLFRTTKLLSSASTKKRYLFTVPKLPYDITQGIPPVLSPQATMFHYDHIHKFHIKHLNYLVEGTPFEKQPLEKLIADNRPEYSTGAYGKEENAIFYHASQAYIHTFTWLSMSPKPILPSKTMVNAICLHFKSGDYFKRLWTNTCRGVFGNGYVWLIEKDYEWQIVPSFAAGSPVGLPGVTPLLCIDLWEHAYMQDYGADRIAYVQNWMKSINWSFVEANYLQLRALESPASNIRVTPQEDVLINGEIPDEAERRYFLQQVSEPLEFAEYTAKRGAPVVTVGKLSSGVNAPIPMYGKRLPKKKIT